ncbi:hypothetical protein Ocin01_05150 [Orchesella cincta]|uniref:Uncharacterized protein n=1 Tax=Orchesella cincta TaxID=48709 RepID=A0A1D2N8F4_ORCCI|nr:hypothetical protein Ocin01_05150 [Orchesella cincta]
MWGELPTVVSEPIRAEADGSLDESAIFSDDTGFFSGEDVYNSEEVEEQEDEDVEEEEEQQDEDVEEEEQVDNRLDEQELNLINDFCTKDFVQRMSETACFTINYDILVELIRKVARALDLIVDLVQRFVNNTAFTSERHNRRNRGPPQPVNNPNPALESPRARAREIDDNNDNSSNRSRNLSIRLASTDSQIVMNFDEIPVDVASRKLFIRKKFNGLVCNTLLDFQFDIHSFYNSDYSSDRFSIHGNFDGGMFLKHLKGISAHRKTDRTITFYGIDSQDYENDTATDEHSEESLSNQTDVGAFDMSDSTLMNEGISESVGMDESEETENQAPHDACFPTVDLHEAPVGINTRKRKLPRGTILGKRRKPFEDVNEAEREILMRDTDGDGVHPLEPTVPSNDLHADLNSLESMIVDPDTDQGYHTQSTICSDAENATLNMDRNDDDLELNDHDGQLRVPSPIFGKDDTAAPSFVLTPEDNVNIHDVISTVENTLEGEIIARGDVSIEDLLRRANFNIKGVAGERGSSSGQPPISLHTILVANLHAVVNMGLYLQPSDDGSFVITATRPD